MKFKGSKKNFLTDIEEEIDQPIEVTANMGFTTPKITRKKPQKMPKKIRKLGRRNKKF